MVGFVTEFEAELVVETGKTIQPVDRSNSKLPVEDSATIARIPRVFGAASTMPIELDLS